MSDNYEDLDLDQIIQIAGPDKNNAYKIREQALAVESLITQFSDSVALTRDAHSHIEGNISMDSPVPAQGTGGIPGLLNLGAFLQSFMESLSTNAASAQTKLLVESGDGNLPVIDPQTKSFNAIADRVETVYDELVAERETRNIALQLAAQDPEHPDLAVYKATDPTEVAAKIRQHHDQNARTIMVDAAGFYHTTIKGLKTPVPYQGPRVPSPNGPGTGGWNNPGGNGRHTQPGPPLNRDRPAPPPIGAPPPAPDVTLPEVSPPDGPSLQGPGPQLPVPGPGVPGPPIGTMPTPPPGGAVPPGVFVPVRPVTPPVIGARPGGMAPRPALTPPRNGLTRPVIGARPGGMTGRGAIPPGGRGAMTGRGAMPPGGRGAMTGRGAIPPGGRGAMTGRGTTPPPSGRTQAPGRAVPPKGGTPVPRQGFGPSGGTRAKPAARVQTGPVRGRTVRTPTPQSVPRGVRTPKIHHGGNDVNRPIIGRTGKARKRTDESTPTPPGDVFDNEWYDVSGTVAPVLGRQKNTEDEYDPGDFVTRHNLGRRNWTV